MKVLHVSVECDQGWLIAQGLEEPGVITQARTLDELLANIRDAAELLLDAKSLHVELILPPDIGRPRETSGRAQKHARPPRHAAVSA